MKKWLIVSIMLITISDIAPAQYKMAVFDSHRIIENSREGQDIGAALAALDTEWQEELRKVAEHLQSARDNLDRQWARMSPELQREKQAEIVELVRHLKDVTEEKWGENGQIHILRDEYSGPLHEKIRVMVDNAANVFQFDIIIDSFEGGVIYTRPGLDLTEALQARLDKAAQSAKIDVQPVKRLATVDMGRLMRAYPAAYEAESTLDQKAADFEEALGRMRNHMQELRSRYESQEKDWRPARRKKQWQEIERQAVHIETYEREKWGEGGELERLRAELFDPVHNRIQNTIRRTAEKHLIDCVLNTEELIFFIDPVFDISDAVMAALKGSSGTETSFPVIGKIAGVDIGRFIEHFPFAANTLKKLEDDNKGWESELASSEHRLHLIQRELEEGGERMGRKRRENLHEEERTLVREIRTLSETKWGPEGEYTKRHNSIMDRIQNFIERTTAQRAAEADVDLVFNRNMRVAFVSQSILDWSTDLTGTPSEPVKEMAGKDRAGKDRAGKEPEKDITPPVIVMTNPAPARGVSIVEKEKIITVSGKATDASGLYEVTVNDQEAGLNADGTFQVQIKLAVGGNTVRIRATDIYSNSAEKVLTVKRESTIASTAVRGDSTAAKTKVITGGHYHALFIACADYTSDDVNDLNFPVHDAAGLKNVLLQHYTFDSTRISFLKDPTRKQIIQTLDQLRSQVAGNDNLLIFYAGHGYWDKDMNQGYWLPKDAAWKDRSAWLSNSTVRDYLRGIKAQHILLIADACFSGGIFKTRNAFKNMSTAIAELYKYPSRKAMSSGTLNEVPDKSVFSEYLIKRLKGSSDHHLSAERLFSLFREAVINNSPTRQIPQFGEILECGDEGGDFIFTRK